MTKQQQQHLQDKEQEAPHRGPMMDMVNTLWEGGNWTTPHLPGLVNVYITNWKIMDYDWIMTFPSYWEWNIIPTDDHSIIFQRGRAKNHQPDNIPLYFHYISIIFPLYFHYISIIFPLYFHYISIIFPLYFHYISIISYYISH